MRNPITQAVHRRETFWQIIFPTIVTLIILIVLAVLSTLGSDSDVSRWADTSAIWLLVPILFICLLFVIILGGLLYLLIRLGAVIPGYTVKAQNFFGVLAAKVRKASDVAAEPVIKVESFVAAVRSFFR